ncbi:UNVERIFIED_CONTAM: DUF1694 domain-containing protein [Streptococcus canis]|uniref:DUF1694 domain-containing protein n=1 Tax=Streptococcus canis TaxID=1329 RepID=A0AAE4Q7J0_STRCB|nr:DUF1694 domain-containing protein [Streptococcus canis]MDV5976843.1 DUF1694 domain-containing protein [Streptococcus canis]
MEQLEDTLLKGALGEKRFNPDQQRYYLGTYAERVVLSLSLEYAQDDRAKNYLEAELANLSLKYQPLALKISSELDPQYQMTYMKIAKQGQIAATIVTEKHMTSPFAFVLHTDHAISPEETRLEVIVNQTENDDSGSLEHKTPKSFWQKLFQ